MAQPDLWIPPGWVEHGTFDSIEPQTSSCWVWRACSPNGDKMLDISWDPAAGRFVCGYIINDDWDRPLNPLRTTDLEKIHAWADRALDRATMSPIIAYYAGVGTDDRGRCLLDVLKWTDAQLEECHDQIQWLFPLPETSNHNHQAPLLTEADMVRFRRAMNPTAEEIDGLRAALEHRPEGVRNYNQIIFLGVMKAYDRFSQFLGLTGFSKPHHWCTPRNHNLLRITRFLRFLTLIGEKNRASGVHGLATLIAERHPGVLTATTREFWDKALTAGFHDW